MTQLVAFNFLAIVAEVFFEENFIFGFSDSARALFEYFRATNNIINDFNGGSFELRMLE